LAVSMVDLERQLKAAVKTGKVTVGRKEVANSLKATKLLVWSASANLSQDLLKQCQSLQIPAVRFEGNPIELGRMAGIPYKVSVLSVKSGGDAKLEAFSGSQDYSVRRVPSFMAPGEPAVEEKPETKEAPEASPKKTAKKAEPKRKKKVEEEASEEKKKPKTRAKRTKRADKEESEDKETKTKAKTAKPKASKKEDSKKKKSKKAEEEEPEDDAGGEDEE
jgi:large subunit ribosomal protein L30e